MAGKEVPGSKDRMFGNPMNKGFPVVVEDGEEKKSVRMPGGPRLHFGSHPPVEMAEWMSGGLRPCTGLHTPSEEEKGEEEVPVKRPSMGGGPTGPILGRHRLAEKEEGVVTGAKRKAADSEGKAAAVSSEDGTLVAAAADETADAAAGDGEDEAPEGEWVEMPEDYLAWLLAQTRETRSVPLLEVPVKSTLLSQEDVHRQRELICKMNTRLQASHDQFFRFQAWVRNKLEMNGRVMVPADLFCSMPKVQQEVSEIWKDEMKKLGMYVPADSDNMDDTD
uniref:Uncharacterized protein n=1 Tax=Arundo donax TaxID=35708 RepID=A0A0A9GB06_ARUDO